MVLHRVIVRLIHTHTHTQTDSPHTKTHTLKREREVCVCVGCGGKYTRCDTSLVEEENASNNKSKEYTRNS